MKVLVTGSNGLYGNGTVRALLEREVEVISLDTAPRPWYMDDLADKVTFIRGDLMNPTNLLRVCKEEKVDRIVHMPALQSAPCEENPWACCYLNIMGTVMALDVARILGLQRVVCAGSVAAAGNVSGVFTEDVPREPTSIYGMTKLAVEHLVENYARSHGVDGLVLRPTWGYGIGPRTAGGLPLLNMIVSALQGEVVKVEDTGRKLELMYYKDGGRAFAMATLADTPPHRVFNLGNGGHQLPLPEVVDIVKEAIPGSQFEIEFTGPVRPPATVQTATDITRIRQELGWTPEYPPQRGIPKHVAWIREHYLPRLT